VRNVITTSRTSRTMRSSISQAYANGGVESSASHNSVPERVTTRPNDPAESVGRDADQHLVASATTCRRCRGWVGSVDVGVRVMSAGCRRLDVVGRTRYSTGWLAGVRCCPDGAGSLLRCFVAATYHACIRRSVAGGRGDRDANLCTRDQFGGRRASAIVSTRCRSLAPSGRGADTWHQKLCPAAREGTIWRTEHSFHCGDSRV
jgi:hypothetical protein